MISSNDNSILMWLRNWGVFILICIYFLYKLLKKNKNNKSSNDPDSDPVIRNLNREIGDLNRKAADSIRNDKERLAIFKKHGIEITGGYGDDNSNQTVKRIPTRAETLFLKYGPEVTKDILNEVVWLKMSKELLIESRGEPDDIEEEITEKHQIETYIYGNKVSGSYFVLKNDVVTKIVDRY